MDAKETQALADMVVSKKYREVYPGMIERIFREELVKRKSVKEAEKYARTRLHAVTGAFMTVSEIAQARKIIESGAEMNDDVLTNLLSLHASTRERLPLSSMDELWREIATLCGFSPKTVLDLACGLNPVYLGARGYAVTACDIHTGALGLIESCASAWHWPVRVQPCDLILPETIDGGEYDIALMMKLLPVLEGQKTGAAMAALEAVHAKFILVSFPTRTLGGRGVGMEKHYSEWFEGALTEGMEIAKRWTSTNELYYLLRTNRT